MARAFFPHLPLFTIGIEPDSVVTEQSDRAAALDALRPLTISLPHLPESVRMTKTANYNDETIPGRSEPWKSYSHSSPTQIEFSFKFVAMGAQDQGPFSFSGLAGKALGVVGQNFSQAAPFLGVAGNTLSTAVTVAEASAAAANPGRLVESAVRGEAQSNAAIVFREVHQKVSWLEALTYPQYDSQGRAYPPPKVTILYGLNFERTGVIRTVSFDFQGPWDVEMYLCYLVETSIVFEESNDQPRGWKDVRNRQLPRSSQVGSPFSTAKLAQTGVDLSRAIVGL